MLSYFIFSLWLFLIVSSSLWCIAKGINWFKNYTPESVDDPGLLNEATEEVKKRGLAQAAKTEE